MHNLKDDIFLQYWFEDKTFYTCDYDLDDDDAYVKVRFNGVDDIISPLMQNDQMKHMAVHPEYKKIPMVFVLGAENKVFALKARY